MSLTGMDRKSKRKLIPIAQLKDLLYRRSLGVSMSLLVKDLGYTITPPTLRTLLMMYGAHQELLLKEHKLFIENGTTPGDVYNSFFPCWVEPTDNIKLSVYQCPNGVRYKGPFPYGLWLNFTENHAEVVRH